MAEQINRIQKLIDSGFLEKLEFWLSKVFRKSTDKKLKWFWCDGVEIIQTNDLAEDIILQEKQITANAWIGENGQDVYRMAIKLGEYSFAKFSVGLDLADCLPDETLKMISIQTDNKFIVLNLK